MSPRATRNCTRVELPIVKKLEVIRHAKTHGHIKAAEHFGIGKTTALMISKSEDEFKYLDEVNKMMGSVRMRRFQQTEVLSVNIRTWEWLKEVMEKGEPITEKLIKQKALSFAHDQSVLNFSASNGWLANFKKRHGVRLSRTGSSSSLAHVNTTPCIKEKEIMKEPMESEKENTPEAKLCNSPTSGWVRIFPEDVTDVDSSILGRKRISQKELRDLMDPRVHF